MQMMWLPGRWDRSSRAYLCQEETTHETRYLGRGKLLSHRYHVLISQRASVWIWMHAALH